MPPIASEPGFYDGKFVKRGGHYGGDVDDAAETGEPGADSNDGQAVHTGQTDQGDDQANLEGMSKDELVAEADRRGVELKSGATKAEILAALKG